jgi:hypothetical protein
VIGRWVFTSEDPDVSSITTNGTITHTCSLAGMKNCTVEEL